VVGAVTSVMPRYVTRGANFSTDNRTVLRVYLASRYALPHQNLTRGLLNWQRSGYFGEHRAENW
jgi:hypothetical protein